MGCLLRQKTTRLHPCGVCLCHAPCTPFISSVALHSPCSSPPLYIKSHHIPSLLYHSTLFLRLLLCLQARRPSRPSGLSPGTSLCGWEPQLCWGVRCCGPQGLCSGWKMASSWDLREACQAFHATAWLETPREVNRDTRWIRSVAFWALMDLAKLNKWMCLKRITEKTPEFVIINYLWLKEVYRFSGE